uniref:Zinc finger MYM-type protein 1 n=1 Tax=Cacopsylla melanoneura TaxID=428564 RepID=A0A8D8ZCY2_9HEMI
MVLADETADIAGKEQLSIGFRYYHEDTNLIKEEFAGFSVLKAQDAATIAKQIETFLKNNGLDPEKCIGLGFDGCSTMAGKEGGVQAILRRKFKNALFFHCANHRLNLVVNDVYKVPEVRNAVSTVKDVIKFFRESTTRRHGVPNLTKMCETRWTEKYKAIKRFDKNFLEIADALEKLSIEGNQGTHEAHFFM